MALASAIRADIRPSVGVLPDECGEDLSFLARLCRGEDGEDYIRGCLSAWRST